MDQFNEFLILLDSNLSGSWWFPILLVGTGIFFTIYLGFPQFRFFGKAWYLVSGKNKKTDADGETTAFEALTTAMSGAVGTGSLAGMRVLKLLKNNYNIWPFDNIMKNKKSVIVEIFPTLYFRKHSIKPKKNTGYTINQINDALKKYVFTDTLHTKVVKNIHGDSSGVRGAAWLS